MSESTESVSISVSSSWLSGFCSSSAESVGIGSPQVAVIPEIPSFHLLVLDIVTLAIGMCLHHCIISVAPIGLVELPK